MTCHHRARYHTPSRDPAGLGRRGRHKVTIVDLASLLLSSRLHSPIGHMYKLVSSFRIAQTTISLDTVRQMTSHVHIHHERNTVFPT